MRTKEQILQMHRLSDESDDSVRSRLDDIEDAMDEYAKQQAIAFYQSFTGYRDIPRHIIEKDYDIFMEQQNKEQ